MEMKLLGFKFRPMVVVACIIVGALISTFVLGSCSRLSLNDVKESFASMGAPTDYTLGEGVKGSYDTRHLASNAPGLDSNQAGAIPLAPGELFFFAKNEFKPECCVPPFSGVSSADGCACVTKEQVDYINMRGGNRSSSSIY